MLPMLHESLQAQHRNEAWLEVSLRFNAVPLRTALCPQSSKSRQTPVLAASNQSPHTFYLRKQGIWEKFLANMEW